MPESRYRRVVLKLSGEAFADGVTGFGIDAMVDRGRTLWEERAAVGDLAALEARSVASQAAALTDPTGLGSHRVVVLGRHL